MESSKMAQKNSNLLSILYCILTLYGVSSNTSGSTKLINSATTLKILAVAGHGYLTDVELVDPYSTFQNDTKPPNYPEMAYGLSGAGTLFCGGFVYGSGDTNKCYRLDDNSWVEKDRLIKPRRHSVLLLLQNDSYWDIGGTGEKESPKTSEFKSDTDHPFTLSASLPEPMYYHCAVTMNDTHIFVAGNHYDTKTAYIVNIRDDPFVFHSIPLMPNQRYGAGCGSLVDRSFRYSNKEETFLIVAGGRGKDHETLTTSSIYSMTLNMWMEGPTLPRGFAYGGYVTDNHYNSFLLVGGMDGNSVKGDIMAYQEDTNTFEILPGKLKIPRRDFAATALFDNIN